MKGKFLWMIVLLICVTGVATVFANGGGDAEAADEVKTAADLDIVYIPKNTGNPYFDSIIGGFEKAAGELGFSFYIPDPVPENPDPAGRGRYRHFPEQS